MLNIGKEKGIIDTKLFSILVVMAIVTTFAASPLFLLVKRNTKNLESFG